MEELLVDVILEDTEEGYILVETILERNTFKREFSFDAIKKKLKKYQKDD